MNNRYNFDKEELRDFFKRNNTFSFKKYRKKYSINNSPFLSASKIQEYLFRTFSIDTSLDTLIEYLDEESKNTEIRESDISDKLAQLENGEREIKTEVGYIDVLTKEEVIEVKKASQWKSAMGQIIAYGKFYPDKKKRIHLYGEMPKNIFDNILKLCKENDIKLTYEYEI